MAKNFFGITDTGKMRSNNEDTFIAETALNGKFIAACVIDGVGGYTGGEVAAKLAHDAILDHLRKQAAEPTAIMKQAITAANGTIYKEKQQSKENEQMACVLTMALADVANNKFYYAHVGDTRLYLFRDSSLVKVTHDHSFVGFLEDSGRLTEEAAMKHPKRNEINKALGFDPQMSNQQDYVETGDSPFLPGDILLLCSDGLTDMISNSAITAVLKTNKSLQVKGKALIQAANDAGGKDNITVVLVHNNKEPLKHEAMKPSLSVKKNGDPQTTATVNTGKDNDQKAGMINKPKSSGAVSVLTILCLILLAAFLWLLFKNYGNKDAQREEALYNNTSNKKERNEQEQKLLDSINVAPNKEVFILNTPGTTPITISSEMLIKNDSLHIIGNGATLIADSSYKGPALTLSENNKYILLDSITFENFDLGILAKSPFLHLKNVQFKNCRVPVQYQAVLPNNIMLNGRFADTIFYSEDVPK